VTVRPIRRLVLAVLALAGIVGALAACTKGSPSAGPTKTIDSTITHSATPGPTGPVSTAKVVSSVVGSCPYLAKQSAADQAGMRLDKITKLTQSGRTVGCRFYALEHPGDGCDASCLAAEHLPPGNQPAIEIVSTKYASSTAARNAFILLAEKGSNYQQEQIRAGLKGLCYQTNFWAHDNGKDWACAFSVGATMVVIRTVVTDPALNVVEIASAIVGKF
jgi:hypothetical protein